MFTIELDHHLDSLATMLSGLKDRSIKYVVANALDDATNAALERLQGQIGDYVDRPTPWTTRSVSKRPKRVTPTKLDLVSFGFKTLDEGDKRTPAGEYLRPIVQGGARPQKRFESRNTTGYTVPRNLGSVNVGGGRSYKFQLDQYGNLPGATYGMVAKSLSGQRTSAARFFRATIRGIDGIYLRVEQQTQDTPKRRSAGKRPMPRGYVLAFNLLSSSPSYEPRFPVSDLLETYFNDVFDSSLQQAVDDELETYMRRRLQGKD